MPNIFLFGTLCHQQLLETVLGRSLTDARFHPAELPDYAVVRAQGQDFPLLTPRVGARAAGRVLRASQDDLDRLNFYEAGFDYVLQEVQPETVDGPVQAYFPAPGTWQPGREWTLEQFVRDHGDLACAVAQELMRLFGKIPGEQAAVRRGLIRDRMSWMYKPHHPGAPTRFGQQDVHILSRRRVHDGFYKVDVLDLTHSTFNGGTTDRIEREIFVASDAVILLPYDPEHDRVLMVEQFRVGALVRLDPHPWKLEPVAGRIEPGDTPEDTARREAQEEAGITLTDLIPLGSSYASPGATTEYFHYFIGIAALPDTDARLGGLVHEGEDIQAHVIEFPDLMKKLERGEIDIGPFVNCILWLDKLRPSLRADA